MPTRPKNALAHRPELDGDALPTMAEWERMALAVTLDHTGGNMSVSAEILRIDRRTMYRKARDHKLEQLIEGYRARPVDVQEVE